MQDDGMRRANGTRFAPTESTDETNQIITTFHYPRDVKQDDDYSGLFEKLGTQSNG